MEDQHLVTYCGLYCGDCPARRGRIADLARDLRKELRRVHFERDAQVLAQVSFFREFKDYGTCYDVLGAMVKYRCKRSCKDGGGPPSCKIRSCCQRKRFIGCWECADFEDCEKFEWLLPVHGDAYLKNLRKIRKKGIEGFLQGKRLWHSKRRN